VLLPQQLLLLLLLPQQLLLLVVLAMTPTRIGCRRRCIISFIRVSDDDETEDRTHLMTSTVQKSFWDSPL
jgi:hypothetical protein